LTEQLYAGIDIGATKTTTILARSNGEFSERDQFPTTNGPNNWLPTVTRATDNLKAYARQQNIAAIGISCGGPLDTKKGLILSPPNLPGWDEVPIVDIIKGEFHLPVYLDNDANAGALAEWQFGAGQGLRNMIFLTFGTGLGAGLIINGRLYAGTNDLAGEAGHIRLAEDGPLGFHKRGSFEGFCSGPGLAQMMAAELLLQEDQGIRSNSPQYPRPDKTTGKDVVNLAKKGDALALRVVERSGTYLGHGLSILIDLLNPEMIIVGSMGYRLGDLLLTPAREVVKKEAIPAAAAACRIVPSSLGEKIGDYAALCAALQIGKD
jgi:glucokinase